MKNHLFTFILLCVWLSASAVAPDAHKQTFAKKDPFQSAVFLRNNEIFNDYRNEHILYYADHDHVNVYFTEKGLIYRVSDKDHKKLKEQKKEKDKEEEGIPVNICTVTMDWVGANPNPIIIPNDQAEGYHTYFKKTDAGYKTIVTNGFRTLTYKDIYPGIDVVYSFPDKGGIEYDLIVRPGADPSRIKMKYGGAIKKIKKDNQGNIHISTTLSGDIIEHAPVSYTDDGPVASSFELSNNMLQFLITNNYDPNKTLTIDPWVTTLTTIPPTNMGFNVDFDFLGDLFVFGAGASNSYDLTDFFQIAKYSPTGTYLWTFGGSVASPAWNTSDPGIINYPSNFIVDRNTGKTYTGQGYYDVGTTTVRVNASGAYDNFISTQNSNVQETWCYAYNCATNAVIGMGGGTTSNLNMGVINTTTGATTPSNVTGLGGTSQDIACGTYDSAGSLYVILANGGPYTNTIYKVNASYTGNSWANNSNYTTFVELANKPFWSGYPNSNGFSCLAANGSYLYYYDGYNVAAYDLTTGNQVGTATTIAGYSTLAQGGIAVDNCNNVYVGGQGVIKTFSFDGSTFTPHADISLSGAFTSDPVFDLRYNSATNLIYATGTGFIGTYVATLSTTCNTVGSYTVSNTHSCNSITVHVSPAASLNPKVFSYVLTNSSGTIVSQLNSTTDTIYAITGLATGTYILQVQWNANCGGSSVTDTISVNCNDTLAISRDTSICTGQPVTLTATASLPGGTYLWSPGGATTSTIHVSPAATTTYTVTCTPLSGPTMTASVTVTILHAPTVTVNDTTVCQGRSATLTATPNPAGGTYRWTPGGATTQSITVTPASTTTYSVTYSLGTCGTATDSGKVTIAPPPTVTASNTSICPGQNATVTATPSQTGGTYLWAPGGGTTQSITVSPATTSYYTVTYTIVGCIAATASDTVTINTVPTVSVNAQSICQGQSATLTATPSLTGGTYSWAPGGATTQSITVSPATTTTYTVTYTATCGTAVDSGVVTVAPTPTVTVNSDTICQGQNATLTATPSRGGGTYSWSPGNSVFSNITVSPSSTTTYTVSYSIPGCLVVNNSGTVNVVIPPVVPVDNASTCLGQSATISANPTIAGGTFSWSPGGETTSGITVSPTITTVYTVTYAIPLSVCPPVSTSDTVTIFAFPTLAVSDTLVCLGASATLSVSPSVAGGSYIWSPGAQVTQNITVTPATTSTYTVTYTFANCAPVTDSGTVTIAPLPFVSISIINAICTASDGQEIALASAGTAPYTYLWNDPSHTTASTLSGLVANSNYSVTVNDINHCTTTASGMVADSITPLPIANTITDITCHGLHNGAISISVPNCNNCTYQWSNGMNGTIDSSLAPGTYILKVTDQNGCTSTASYTIADPAPATLSIMPNDSTVIEDSLMVLYPVFGPYPQSSIVSYNWSPALGLSCTDCAQPVFSSVSGYYSYSLVIDYNQGCQVTDSVNVIVVSQHFIYVPNAFTPNGNGTNDVYMVYPRGGIRYISLSIFNRWGEKVFETLDPGKGWDGTYKGQMQEPGVYIYTLGVTFDDNISISKKGSITLIN